MNRRARAGVALLESIIALLLFGTVVTGMLRLHQQVLVTNAHANQAEVEMVAANRLMEAVVLWPVVDLTQRLGSRAQGQFVLEIERIAPTLFELRITNGAARELLRTIIYRPCCVPEQ